MKNKIIRVENKGEAPCICCGKKTAFVNYEKQHKEKNSGFVCDDCNSIKGELILEEPIEIYICPNCDEIKNPVRAAGNLMICPNDFCGAAVQKKE